MTNNDNDSNLKERKENGKAVSGFLGVACFHRD